MNESLIADFFQSLQDVKKTVENDLRRGATTPNSSKAIEVEKVTRITRLYDHSKNLFVQVCNSLNNNTNDLLEKVLLPFVQGYGFSQASKYLLKLSGNPQLLGRIMASYLSHVSHVPKTVDLFHAASSEMNEEALFVFLREWELTFRALEGLDTCSSHPKYSHILGQMVFLLSTEETRVETSKNVLIKLLLGPWIDEIPLKILESKQRDRFGLSNLDSAFFRPASLDTERFHIHSNLLSFMIHSIKRHPNSHDQKER